jgi:hypothetical protein
MAAMLTEKTPRRITCEGGGGSVVVHASVRGAILTRGHRFPAAGGSSWQIRVWILDRCNTTLATRTSRIRFDIANFLLSGFAISGRTRERLAEESILGARMVDLKDQVSSPSSEMEVTVPRHCAPPLSQKERKWPCCKFRRGHAYAPGSAATSESTGLSG